MAKDRIGRNVVTAILLDGRKEVAATATAEALTSTSTLASYVIITAETNNTGVMAVGGSTVVGVVATRRGIPLNAGDSISLGAVDLSKVYIDGTVNGDGVTYLYLL